MTKTLDIPYNDLPLDKLDMLIEYIEEITANFMNQTGCDVAQASFEATLKTGEVRSVTLDELKELRQQKGKSP